MAGKGDLKPGQVIRYRRGWWLVVATVDGLVADDGSVNPVKDGVKRVMLLDIEDGGEWSFGWTYAKDSLVWTEYEVFG